MPVFTSRDDGVGERRKLPQSGPGRSPGRKRVLLHFGFEKKNKPGDDKFDIFAQSLGGRPLRPPLTGRLKMQDLDNAGPGK